MNRQASVLFNLISSSSGDNCLALQSDSAQRSYYQRLIYFLLSRSIYATESFQLLGSQLADVARHAYLARQMDAVEQTSQIMLALPISGQLRTIARHYQALCAKRKGDYDNARQLLERVVEEATPQYRARALQVIGATYYECGEMDSALPFYISAGKAAAKCDLLTLAESQAMIAVVRSIHGDHKQALDDLENLFPLVRTIGKRYPAFYYEYLNSLAVELGEVGRIDEAKAACAITLASPFSAAYPNWAETRDELDLKRTAATPSVIAVSAAPEPALSSQPERSPELIRSFALIHLARNKNTLQRTIITTTATATIVPVSISQIVLDRVRYSIDTRGPPSRFRN